MVGTGIKTEAVTNGYTSYWAWSLRVDGVVQLLVLDAVTGKHKYFANLTQNTQLHYFTVTLHFRRVKFF